LSKNGYVRAGSLPFGTKPPPNSRFKASLHGDVAAVSGAEILKVVIEFLENL